MFFLLAALSLSIKRRPILIKLNRYANQDLDMCEICQGLIVGIRTFLENGYSDDEISKLLNSQCTIDFPDDTRRRGFCQEIASTYLPIEIYLVKNNVENPDICRKLGYCSSLANTIKSRKPSRVLSLSTETSPECLHCAKFISWSRAKKVVTPSQLKTLVTKDCAKIQDFNAICNQISDDNLEQVFDFINSRTDETVACELSKLC